MTNGTSALGTAARGRGRRPAATRPTGQWPMPERSLLPSVLGVPPAAAVAIAFGLTALGVFVDIVRIGTVGAIFQIGFVTGCALAVAWVRRRSLFAPMVQPPLLLAVVVPSIVLLSGSPRPGAGIAEDLLVVGAPMVNAFPTMAWTTAIVLLIGLGRILTQRASGSVTASRGSGAARAGGRRPASPRRS